MKAILINESSGQYRNGFFLLPDATVDASCTRRQQEYITHVSFLESMSRTLPHVECSCTEFSGKPSEGQHSRPVALCTSCVEYLLLCLSRKACTVHTLRAYGVCESHSRHNI
jgi:hypothetical protein